MRVLALMLAAVVAGGIGYELGHVAGYRLAFFDARFAATQRCP